MVVVTTFLLKALHLLNNPKKRKVKMKNSYFLPVALMISMVTLFANLVMAASGTITFTVHGVVTDVDTKQPLVGVVVTLHDGSAGTVTDDKGRFRIDVVSNDESGLLD